MSAALEFLTLDDVLALHEAQLDRFGGGSGVREPGLLESAIAQPQASFGGELLHQGLFEQACAYLFHLVSNHPFVDGDKRVGLLAALTFLHLNGVRVLHGSRELYALTMAIAEGRMAKEAVGPELERIARLPWAPTSCPASPRAARGRSSAAAPHPDGEP